MTETTKPRVASAGVEDDVLTIQWLRPDKTGVMLSVHPNGDCGYTIRADPNVGWGQSGMRNFMLADGYPAELLREIGSDG